MSRVSIAILLALIALFGIWFSLLQINVGRKFSEIPGREIELPDDKSVSDGELTRNLEKMDELINHLDEIEAGNYGLGQHGNVLMTWNVVPEFDYEIGERPTGAGIHEWFWDEQYTIVYPIIGRNGPTGKMLRAHSKTISAATQLHLHAERELTATR